jgi:hypothetical protein
MSQGLEADFERDFTHAQIGVEQQIFGFFNPHPGKVIGEIDSGNFLEHFAEIKRAGIARLGHMTQAKVFRLMFLNELFGLDNNRWFCVLVLDHDLIAQHGQVLRKNR